MSSASKILFIGGVDAVTPLVKASINAGHPTFVLVEPSGLATHFLKIGQFKLRGAHISVVREKISILHYMRSLCLCFGLFGKD